MLGPDDLPFLSIRDPQHLCPTYFSAGEGVTARASLCVTEFIMSKRPWDPTAMAQSPSKRNKSFHDTNSMGEYVTATAAALQSMVPDIPVLSKDEIMTPALLLEVSKEDWCDRCGMATEFSTTPPLASALPSYRSLPLPSLISQTALFLHI